jgi:hypothetical protein
VVVLGERVEPPFGDLSVSRSRSQAYYGGT